MGAAWRALAIWHLDTPLLSLGQGMPAAHQTLLLSRAEPPTHLKPHCSVTKTLGGKHDLAHNCRAMGLASLVLDSLKELLCNPAQMLQNTPRDASLATSADGDAAKRASATTNRA